MKHNTQDQISNYVRKIVISGTYVIEYGISFLVFLALIGGLKALFF